MVFWDCVTFLVVVALISFTLSGDFEWPSGFCFEMCIRTTYRTSQFTSTLYKIQIIALISGLFSHQLAKYLSHTIKLVLRGHSKIDKTKILMTNGNLIKVKSIVECSPLKHLLYYWHALNDKRS